MTQPSLPPGLTMEMMTAIGQFLQQQKQEAEQAIRPSGTLKPDQIRGVNPRYAYQYREYPKALQPPPVQLHNEVEERTFRSKNRMPLPWPQQEMIDRYYLNQRYPVLIKPPQLVVGSAHEEAVKRAEWNEAMGEVAQYPRYMFHPTTAPKMVDSLEEEQGLGEGWFPTIKEATDAAIRLSNTDRVREDRTALLDKAKQLGVEFSPTWSNKRLQEAIEKREAA